MAPAISICAGFQHHKSPRERPMERVPQRSVFTFRIASSLSRRPARFDARLVVNGRLSHSISVTFLTTHPPRKKTSIHLSMHLSVVIRLRSIRRHPYSFHANLQGFVCGDTHTCTLMMLCIMLVGIRNALYPPRPAL